MNVSDPISSATQRRMGYERSIAAAGLSPLVLETATVSGGTNDVLTALQKQGIEYDGIFAFSDLLAMEAAGWMMQHGIRIPEDVALVGYDDVLSCAHLPFALTSITADREMEAQRTVALLFERMKQPDAAPKTERFPVSLIARQSSAYGKPAMQVVLLQIAEV